MFQLGDGCLVRMHSPERSSGKSTSTHEMYAFCIDFLDLFSLVCRPLKEELCEKVWNFSLEIQS